MTPSRRVTIVGQDLIDALNSSEPRTDNDDPNADDRLQDGDWFEIDSKDSPRSTPAVQNETFNPARMVASVSDPSQFSLLVFKYLGFHLDHRANASTTSSLPINTIHARITPPRLPTNLYGRISDVRPRLPLPAGSRIMEESGSQRPFLLWIFYVMVVQHDFTLRYS